MTESDTFRRSLTTSLHHAGRHWRRVAAHAMAAHNISEAVAAPLLWIGRLGGGVKQVQLASYVGIEGPSLVRLLDQLEQMQLVVRKEDPNDRRAKNLWLTPAGKELTGKVESLLVDLRTKLLKGVSRKDIETTMRVLALFENADAEALVGKSE